MARTVAPLPAGARSTDYISLGVITKTFPLTTVRAVLAASGKASLRERDLPAHVVMYYVIALALFMQASYREVLRCLLEGLQWLRDPALPLQVAGKSGGSGPVGGSLLDETNQCFNEGGCNASYPIRLATTSSVWAIRRLL